MQNRSKQYWNPRATEEPRAELAAWVLKQPIRANGKFWGKLILIRDPGEVHKTTLDEEIC